MLRFRHLLEEHHLSAKMLLVFNTILTTQGLLLKTGSVVDATLIGALINTVEPTRASIRGKVEHPFRVIKCQFGFTKVRYRGLMKNTAQLNTLFALSNLWMARKHILLSEAQG